MWFCRNERNAYLKQPQNKPNSRQTLLLILNHQNAILPIPTLVTLKLLVLIAHVHLALVIAHLASLLEAAIAHLALEHPIGVVGCVQPCNVRLQTDVVTEVAAAY